MKRKRARPVVAPKALPLGWIDTQRALALRVSGAVEQRTLSGGLDWRCVQCNGDQIWLRQDGQLVATTDSDKRGVFLEIVDPKQDKVLTRIRGWGGDNDELQRASPAEMGVVFGPEGKRAVVYCVIDIARSPAIVVQSRLYDAKTWKLLAASVGSHAGVDAMPEDMWQFGLGGSALFVTEEEQSGLSVDRYDAATGKRVGRVAMLGGRPVVRWSADRHRLLFADGPVVLVRDLPATKSTWRFGPSPAPAPP